MKIDVTTKNEDGSVAGTFSLNRAEVSTLCQYSINHLMALGYVFDTQVPTDDETIRFKQQEPTGTLN